jgi:hypothetical protein
MCSWYSINGHAACPAAIRRLGVTGKMPVPSEGWTPFEAQRPWQDRRTLIAQKALSVSQSCAWSLRFSVPRFRETMKEDRNV